MASYTLFNTSKEINESISGVNEFFDDSKGFTGLFKLIGTGTIDGSLLVNGLEIAGGEGGGGVSISGDSISVDSIFTTSQIHSSGELNITGNSSFGESGVANRSLEFVRSNKKRQSSNLILGVDLQGSTTGELFIEDSSRISLNSGLCYYNINAMGYTKAGQKFAKEIKGITTSGEMISRSDTTLFTDSSSYGLDLKVIDGNLQLIGTGATNMDISADVYIFENFDK